MAASSKLGSILKVSGSISTKTGLAPVKTMLLTEAIKVKGVVMTSSPGPISWANRATWRAVVPEEVAMACLTPQTVANFSSKAAVRGP